MNNNTPVIPTDVRLETNVVAIDWSDGDTSIYPYRDLRIECPCAACVEEMTGRRILNVISIPENIFAVDYLEIGRYAIQFAWSDGHTTGIYPFTMLRKLSSYSRNHQDNGDAEAGIPPSGSD